MTGIRVGNQRSTRLAGTVLHTRWKHSPVMALLMVAACHGGPEDGARAPLTTVGVVPAPSLSSVTSASSVAMPSASALGAPSIDSANLAPSPRAMPTPRVASTPHTEQIVLHQGDAPCSIVFLGRYQDERQLLVLASARATNDPAAMPESLRSVGEMAAARAPDEPKDIRFARAWLRAEIERTATDDRKGGALLIHDKGHWFELPGGERIACGARQALGRILLALAVRRLAAPGEALSRAELVSAGWPDERILSSVEANRLHVTIRRLRKLGLAPWLETLDAGYRLKPTDAVRIVSGG